MKLQAPAAEDLRRRELARIHVLKKDLGLNDDLYRDILTQVVGVGSAGDLDQAGRRRLLDHLEGLVKRLSKGSDKRGKPGVQAPASGSPQRGQVAKIRALWAEMSREGIVHDSSERAMNHFVERVTGVGQAEWLLDARKANAVIEALKSWWKREAKKKAAQSGRGQDEESDIQGVPRDLIWPGSHGD